MEAITQDEFTHVKAKLLAGNRHEIKRDVLQRCAFYRSAELKQVEQEAAYNELLRAVRIMTCHILIQP